MWGLSLEGLSFQASLVLNFDGSPILKSLGIYVSLRGLSFRGLGLNALGLRGLNIKCLLESINQTYGSGLSGLRT